MAKFTFALLATTLALSSRVRADLTACFDNADLRGPAYGGNVAYIAYGAPGDKYFDWAIQSGTRCDGYTFSANVYAKSDGSLVKACESRFLNSENPETTSETVWGSCLWDPESYDENVAYELIGSLTDSTGTKLDFPARDFTIVYTYAYECRTSAKVTGVNIPVSRDQKTIDFDLTYSAQYCPELPFQAEVVDRRSPFRVDCTAVNYDAPFIPRRGYQFNADGIVHITCPVSPAEAMDKGFYRLNVVLPGDLRPIELDGYTFVEPVTPQSCANAATAVQETVSNFDSTSEAAYSKTFSFESGACSSETITLQDPSLTFTSTGNSKRDVTKVYPCELGGRGDTSVTIVCPSVQQGSMATFGVYTVSVNACNLERVCETISQPFIVTHAGNPSATGGFRRRMLCESPKLACAREKGFDCIDPLTDIWSCGGCSGTDCTTLANSTDVECHQGQCRALGCEYGFRAEAGSCITEDVVSAVA